MNIVLRQWKKTDVQGLVKIANNKKVWDNVRDRLPHPYTESDAKEWLALVKKQATLTTFCIEVDGEVAGSIGITLFDDVYSKVIEIGYFVGEDWWGKGIATEAVKQLLAYIEKNFDAVRIFAGAFEHNTGSMRVLEKNGFHLESIRKKGVVKNGIVMDEHIYVKLL